VNEECAAVADNLSVVGESVAVAAGVIIVRVDALMSRYAPGTAPQWTRARRATEQQQQQHSSIINTESKHYQTLRGRARLGHC